MFDELFDFDAPLFDDSNAPDGSFWLDQTFNGARDETNETVSARAIKIRAKREMLRMTQKENLAQICKEPPKPGEEIHVVSANKLEFYTWIPYILDWIGATDEFYCATWTASFNSARDFLREWDAGRIRKTAGFILGTHFKRREPVVYTKLAEGLQARGGWIKVFETHCKVMLLNNEQSGDYLTVEGSANLTANPRLENMVIFNDRDLWEFHRKWFLEMKELKTKMPWA